MRLETSRRAKTPPGLSARRASLAGCCACLLLLSGRPTSGAPANEALEDRVPATSPAGLVPLATHASKNVYFGDMHVHTAFSADAFIFGTRASIDDAFRYAKGESIAHVSGTPIQANRPLDFLAVTDHAEYLGMQDRLLDPASLEIEPAGDYVAGISRAFAVMSATVRRATPHPGWIDAERNTTAWQETIEAAERHDAPGRFTTLLGFEWSATPEGRNLHRNVIIDPSAVIPDRAFSVFDAAEPEGLWRWMDAERARGARLLAIPHNSNLSDGAMFARTDSFGQPFDRRYAEDRARNEPLVEVTQIKGTSETHPILSPQDAYADFEIWSSRVVVDGEDPNVAVAGSYVRDALRRGLELKAEIGLNPYRFGLIGSTDSHSASSPVEEDNYSGKGVQDTTTQMRLEATPISVSAQAWGASGLTAVWARENSRPEIFAGLARRETYATTGTRIRLRFFGGWRYAPGFADAPDWESRAYLSGTAMGGVLPVRSDGATSPHFVAAAQRDPEGAKLDRLQIVKGWMAGGESRERIFDVALAPDGGADELSRVWVDPDFDPAVEAFYYVRVIEVPTPRWSTWDAELLGVEPLSHLPRLIQERAFSSPIWYEATPDAG